MVDFIAGVICGLVIGGFVLYQIGFVKGRRSALDEKRKGRHA